MSYEAWSEPAHDQVGSVLDDAYFTAIAGNW